MSIRNDTASVCFDACRYPSRLRPVTGETGEITSALVRLRDGSPMDIPAQEQLLRGWLRELDPFRKKVLRATLTTFDTHLTALCYAPEASAAPATFKPVPLPAAIPCLLLLESLTASEISRESNVSPFLLRQPFLAVAVADVNSLRDFFAAAGHRPALLPFTPELLESEADPV